MSNHALANVSGTISERLPLWPLGIVLGLLFGISIGLEPLISIGVLAGLVAAFVAVWRPFIGFLLVVAVLPADISGTIGGTGGLALLSITKILGALALGTALLDHLIQQRAVPWLRWFTPQSYLSLAFWMIYVLSSLAHPSEESGKELVRLTIILFFVFVTIYFIDSHQRLQAMVLTLIVAATSIALHSLGQRFLGGAQHSLNWEAQAGAVLDVGEQTVGQMLRTTGTFSHPGWLGLYLSLTFALTLWLIATHVSLGIRLLAGGAALVQVFGILSTYSRMSYLGVALAVFMFAVRRRIGIAVIVIGMSAGIALYPALPNDFRTRIESIYRYRESSSNLTRIGQQLAAWEMIKANPVLGVGPGNFENKVLDYDRFVGEPFRVQDIGAHNIYAEVAAETGLVGVLLLTLLLVWSWISTECRRREFRRRSDFSSAVLWECLGIALAVFAMSGLFVHAQYRKEWWLVVAITAAGISLQSRVSSKPTSAQENRDVAPAHPALSA